MTFPTVLQCCCCIDLRVGGLIIGWLGIICTFISLIWGIANGQAAVAAASFIIANISNVCWLYGIFKNKSAFMLPAVILTGLGVILLYMYSILLIYNIIVIFKNIGLVDIPIFTLLSILLVIYFIISVFATYLFIVIRSIYLKIKDDASATNTRHTSPA
ncbi:uncharacterized protein LOC116343415 [Contarinia nasturtii]|uniref:uncharacterized protein LOC116343415 n=1 Tax=Contarinia nasturtii TaxID=265458 RepID=UPI0012D3AD8E|nr:uncharacterized protein LOC116343415 [Contarinia nasturtii]